MFRAWACERCKRCGTSETGEIRGSGFDVPKTSNFEPSPVSLVSRVPPVSPVLEVAELLCEKITGCLRVVRDISL